MSTSSICVVLPALDEADALPKALEGRPEHVRVIVVDNGSSDATADVARSLGADVVVEARRGFGAACKTGFDAAMPCDVVVFMDADGTCAWEDLPALVEPITNGDADLVLGRRVRALRERGSMPFHVGLAVTLLGRACGRLAGVSVHDVPPYRAISSTALAELALEDRTYGWPLEMVLKAGRSNMAVIEVPVRYRVRVGTSKVTGTLRGTLAATKKMSGVLWDYRR